MSLTIQIVVCVSTFESRHYPKQRNGGVVMEMYFMRITEMFMAGLIILNGVMMIISASDLGGINEWLQKHFACFRPEEDLTDDRSREKHGTSRNVTDLK